MSREPESVCSAWKGAELSIEDKVEHHFLVKFCVGMNYLFTRHKDAYHYWRDDPHAVRASRIVTVNSEVYFFFPEEDVEIIEMHAVDLPDPVRETQLTFS